MARRLCLRSHPLFRQTHHYAVLLFVTLSLLLSSFLCRSQPSPYAELEALLRTPSALRLQSAPNASRPFILFRALGNDLPPLHSLGQTRRSLYFILSHEPKFPEIERRWLLNGIVRVEEELALVRMLVRANEPFHRRAIGLDRLQKIDVSGEGIHQRVFGMSEGGRRRERMKVWENRTKYVIWNNGARNWMIEEGIRAGCIYVMAWDGNCFLNRRAWEEIRSGLGDGKYVVVDMARVSDNNKLKNENYKPERIEDEAQIMIRRDGKMRYDERMGYGYRPKIEFLWRLGIGGEWDKFRVEYGPWGRGEKREEVGEVKRVGWVARLESGGERDRGKGRVEGVEGLMAEAHLRWVKGRGWRWGRRMLKGKVEVGDEEVGDFGRRFWEEIEKGRYGRAKRVIMEWFEGADALAERRKTLRGDVELMTLPWVLEGVKEMYGNGGLNDSEMERIREWVREYVYSEFEELRGTGWEEEGEEGVKFDVHFACVGEFAERWEIVLRHTLMGRLRGWRERVSGSWERLKEVGEGVGVEL